MNPTGPTVTLMLFNFNDSKYLPGALERALKQTRLPDEIYIVDDGSTDESLDIIESYQEKNKGLITIGRNEKNIGVMPSVVRHLPQIKSDYVWFHAADDVFLPTFLEKQYAMAVRYPQAALVFSDLGFFTDSPDKISAIHRGWGGEAKYFSPSECEQEALSSNINAHCIVHRERLLASHCVEPRLRWHCDLIWNYALAFKHGVCYVPETLSLFYTRPDSYSARRFEDKATLHDTYACIMDLLHNELSDIAHHFVLGQVMDQFERPLVDFVLSTPKYRDPLSIALIQPFLQERTQEFLRRKWDRITNEQHPQSLLERELPRLADWTATLCINSGKTRIAIYGAGKQTELLLEHWNGLKTLTIACILTSDAPIQDSCYGIPTCQAQYADPNAFDLILLSSMSYEREMKETATLLFPNTPIIPFWNQVPSPGSLEVKLLSERIPRLLGMLNALRIETVTLVGLPHLAASCKQLWIINDGPKIHSHRSKIPPTPKEANHCIVILDKGIPSPNNTNTPVLRMDINQDQH